MGKPLVSPDIRDVLSVLAYLYVMFDQPDDAARLLAAVDCLDPGSDWARRARCFALLAAGRYADAVAAGNDVLKELIDDSERLPVLRVMVKACWRLGLRDEARTHQRKIQSLAAVTVLPTRLPGTSP